MNYLLANRMEELNEMKELIKQTESLENQILAEGSISEDNLLTRKFKDNVNAIRFYQSNIIPGIKYIEVENEEDFNQFSEIIEFVKGAKYCEFNDNLSEYLIDNLYNKEGNYELVFRLYAYNLIKNNKSFFKHRDGVETINIVAQALRDAKTSKSTNPVVDMYFDEYYKTRKLIEMADEEDWSYGKSLVEYVANDFDIEEKYLKIIKSAYRDYLLEEKYQNMNLKSRAAIGTSQVLSFPIKLTSQVLKLGLVCVDLAGLTFKFVGSALAFPFEKIADKIQARHNQNKKFEAYLTGKHKAANKNADRFKKANNGADIDKAESNAERNQEGLKEDRSALATAVALPGKLFKGVGNLVDMTARVSSTLLNIGIDVATIPFDYLVKGILKVGDVKFKDKVKYADNNIKRNLVKVLKENDKVVNYKDISILNFSAEGNVLSVVCENIKDRYCFKADYQIDDKTAEKINALEEAQNKVLKSLIENRDNSLIKGNFTEGDFIQIEKYLDSREKPAEEINQSPIESQIKKQIEMQIEEDFGFEKNKEIKAKTEFDILGGDEKIDNSINKTLYSLNTFDLAKQDFKFDKDVFAEAQIVANVTKQRCLDIQIVEEDKIFQEADNIIN